MAERGDLRVSVTMDVVGDFHIHTKWCGHAEGEMEEYVARACDLGLPMMGFTAHFPVDMPNVDKVCLEPQEVDLYVAETRRLQKAFKGDIEILMGFETDYAGDLEEHIKKECIDRWSPDYVMGSIHVIDGWPFDHPGYTAEYAKWKIADLYRTYFARLEKLVKSGLFDVVGHIDLVKKFGYRPGEDVSKSFEHLLDVVADKGILVEVNTAGFDKPVGEMYPSIDILSAASARNIGIILGSDSHAPEQVGRYFDKALGILRDADYGAVGHKGPLPFYKSE